MNRLFYDGQATERAGGIREIPELLQIWMVQQIKEHSGGTREGKAFMTAAFLLLYRHLSPSPVLSIPHDIVSFWDEVLKKPIPCPDESRYFEWCYWMLKNERPVHQIQLENEVDKVVYTVGHIVKEPYQDTMVEHTVKSLHWRGNYWSYRNEKGDGISINGPINGDDYHRDRFQLKADESSSLHNKKSNNNE